MIRSGMLLVSFADVDREFWPHLGCTQDEKYLFILVVKVWVK